MAIFEKDGKGKDRFDLIPTDVLQQVAKVLTAGAVKYTENTWHTNDMSHHTAAAMRHFEAFRRGEFIDTESKLPHLAHAITNMMFLYENTIRKAAEKQSDIILKSDVSPSLLREMYDTLEDAGRAPGLMTTQHVIDEYNDLHSRDHWK